MMRLQCEDLTRTVDGRTILKGVSLDAAPGLVTVIMGPNGSGKTTLLRLLALLDRPTSGAIFYGGREVSHLSTEARRQAALIFQNPVLLDRSVRENLLYGAKKRKNEMPEKKAISISESLGIAHLMKRPAKVLSGGEKKRVMIGMALMCDPAILFLDEPFANLDLLSSRIIDDFLIGFRNGGKKTILLATHDISKARLLGDKILLIKSGSIIRETNREDLFYGSSGAGGGQGRNIVRAEIVERGAGPIAVLPSGQTLSVITHLRGEASLLIPPTDITLSLEPFSSSARNVLEGKVIGTEEENGMVVVTIDAGLVLDAIVTAESAAAMDLRPCSKVCLTFKASSLHVFRE